jgi:hypothetical protein
MASPAVSPRVVVGVSGSLSSLAALRYGVQQARHHGGELHAVLAWTPPGGESGARGRTPAPLLRAWRDHAETRLRTAFEEAMGGPPLDLPVRALVVRGRPGPVLVAVADRGRDLLVLGATQVGPLRRLAGTVNGYCAARARCLVVVVPPPVLAVALAGGRRTVERVR